MMSKKELLKQIGSRIKQKREEKGITQQELASLCNFEKSNMSRIESGGTNMTVHTLHKIATALEVNLADLMV